jgi:hypothetical protein
LEEKKFWSLLSAKAWPVKTKAIITEKINHLEVDLTLSIKHTSNYQRIPIPTYLRLSPTIRAPI